MKPIFLILGTAWLLSLGAAYLIGNGSRKGPESAGTINSSPYSTLRSTSSKSARGGSHSPDSARPSHAGRSQASEIVASQPPHQAVIELAHLTDPIERARGFLALIETLGPDEFRAVVADFRALGITEQRMSEYGMLLHAWGKSNPEEALDYAMTKTGTPFARQTILASWAADDPTAALAFARDHHEGDGANPLLVGVIRGIAPSDLNRATDLLQDLPYSRERGDALQIVLPFVLQNGAEIALNWTNGIADERLKSGAIGYIMSDISDHEPERAAQLLVTLADNNAAVRVADEVAGSLARFDLQQAITWSATLQDDVRAEAVEGIISHYASQDPHAASEWLGSLSGTTNLDSAIRSFAWTSQRKNPELAAEWIGQIQNEERRTEMYRGVLSRWWGADASAAEQWIQETPNLPESVQQLPERLQRSQQEREQRSFRQSR
ncbi:MAG: hypothetical protein VCA73_04335 [Roseibacillus sp.]|jgi:hypothetical protein